MGKGWLFATLYFLRLGTMKVNAVDRGSIFLNMENGRPPKKEIKKQKVEKSFSEHLKEQLEKKV